MDQVWFICNFANGEYLENAGKLENIFQNGNAADLAKMLAMPVMPKRQGVADDPIYEGYSEEEAAEAAAQAGPSGATATATAIPSSRTSLEGLPAELILKIFEFLDLKSSFHLVISAPRFWELGWHRFVRRYLYPWVGSRLICVNTRSQPTELPSGMYRLQDDRRYGLPGRDGTMAFYLVSNLIVYGPYARKRWVRKVYHEADRLPSSKKNEVIDLIRRRQCAKYFPRNECWVLRNLTTREYVRADELVSTHFQGEPKRSLFNVFLALGDAILSRICHSPTVPFVTGNANEINRGVWAGHRFEICTISRHQALSSTTQWTDVTYDIIAELSGIVNMFPRPTPAAASTTA